VPDERTRRAWNGLVKYANAKAIDTEELRATISDCMPWSTASDPWGLLAGMRGEWLQEQGAKYQSAVKATLLWLCTDRKARDVYRPEAKGFLYEHLAHISLTLGEVPYTPEDPDHFDESRRYWEHGGHPRDDSPLESHDLSKSYKDIADPVCDFLLNEYQKYRNGEYKDPVPIFLCTNPDCGKLVMPQRIGRKAFCSDECKAAKQRQEIPQQEQTDYQWLYRLSNKTEGVKRAELRSKSGQDRFNGIKARNYGPRCKRLIDKLDRFSSSGPKSLATTGREKNEKCKRRNGRSARNS
jgi:hypothetical protein